MNVTQSSVRSGRKTRMGLLTEPAGYVDGTNLYEYEGSAPAHSLDDLGTDRYLTNELTSWHVGVAVDTWEYDPKTGTYTNTGQMTYDFSVDWNSSWWAIGAIWHPGVVVPSPGLTIDDPVRYPSTPEADIAMKAHLDSKVANPPGYSAVFYNCRDFANEAKLVGLSLKQQLLNANWSSALLPLY